MCCYIVAFEEMTAVQLFAATAYVPVSRAIMKRPDTRLWGAFSQSSVFLSF